MKTVFLLLAIAGMTATTAAVAQPTLPETRAGTFKTDDGLLLRGSGTIIGAPISIHNYLHFKQAADKLHGDFVAIQRQDGGTLTPTHDAELRTRYFELTQQIQNWTKFANK